VLVFIMVALCAVPLAAQDLVRGTITRRDDGRPLEGATVSIVGTSLAATTGPSGRFVLHGVPAGGQRLRVVRIGYAPLDVAIAPDQRTDIQVVMDDLAVSIADLTVTAVSRVPERLVEAPGAIARLDPVAARDLSIIGQPAAALAALPGVDVVQTDAQDFNLSARGFNTVFNRRVLVLLDGRDLAINFLGSQEWMGLSATLEDMARVEFVRGPSAALYGANAFSGVLNMVTPTARETPGSRVSASGGNRGSMRLDVRHAGLFGGDRWGYRLSAGTNRGDAWSQSRTNIGDLAREYAPAIDTAATSVVHPFPGYELRALNGQSTSGTFGLPSPATGEADPVTGTYGTARLDYYAPGGGVFTAEGGSAVAHNATLLGSAARFQITESQRPWARLAWATDAYHLMAWYSGRTGLEQHNLAAGTQSVDHSRTFHLEGQFNRSFAGDRGRIVAGASWRSASVNTEGTLVAPEYDDRTDRHGAIFSQVDFAVTDRLKLVGAARVDASNLFATQVSPKAAAVYTLAERQSLRFTYGRAFEMPNILDFFVRLPAGPPADFSGLEAALRASPVGPALASAPSGTLFTTSSAVPLLALGNPDLDVERVSSYEIGYKGEFGPLFVTVDAFHSTMDGFVTDVLPGVNPGYLPWTAPTSVAPADRAMVEGAVRGFLLAGGQGLAAAALTRLADGSSALVLSIGNAGRATIRGVELGTTLTVSRQVKLDANISVQGFDLDASTFVDGDVVEPNSPERKGNLSVMVRDVAGLDATVNARFTSGYAWSAGTFSGPVPATTTINVTASYPVTPGLRVTAVATNLFDQRRFQNFGGAVIGRQLTAGINARL
jgi:outer membrane receptor for ferrienterochelin and colicins